METTSTDRDLMLRFVRRQDRQAFAELVRRWDRRVLAFLAKASADRNAAEDLRQEVFVRLYRYGGTYDSRFAFSTWLFRIVRNVLKTWQVKQHQRQAVERPPADGSGMADAADCAPNPCDRAVLTELADRTRAAIARLPVDDRELLLLRFDLGLNYREIGEILGAPETTAKSRLYAVLGRLRKSLGDAGVSERSQNV